MRFPIEDRVADLLRTRHGHFVFESGHHGETWLDLDLLFWRPERVRPVAEALAERLVAHEPEAVCGPLTEGGFLALLVALGLGLPFAYTQARPMAESVTYDLPPRLAAKLHGKRVAIVDDVVNAGSAVRGTLAALERAGAAPAAIGAMAVYGDSANELARVNGLALEALVTYPSRIWQPGDCPLCAGGVPLDPRA